MQLVIYNTNSKTKKAYRINAPKGLFELSDKFPGLKHILLREAESPDLMRHILRYFNRMQHIHACLHNDNPMQKAESMSPQNPDVFRTKLHAWADKRSAQARNPVETGNLNSQDPGRLSESKEEVKSTDSILGKLADRFRSWRNGNDNR